MEFLFYLSLHMCEMKLVHTNLLAQPGLTVCRGTPVYVNVYHPRHTVNPHLYLRYWRLAWRAPSSTVLLMRDHAHSFVRTPHKTKWEKNKKYNRGRNRTHARLKPTRIATTVTRLYDAGVTHDAQP
jgi:hypothetical protein